MTSEGSGRLFRSWNLSVRRNGWSLEVSGYSGFVSEPTSGKDKERKKKFSGGMTDVNRRYKFN